MAATVTVEDGSGVAGANSYVSVADWKAYAVNNGWDYAGAGEGATAYTDDQIGAALIRAATWLDAAYYSRWPGVPTYLAEQPMAWPRKAGCIIQGQFVASDYLLTVTDARGIPIAVDAIPLPLIRAQNEAAWRELQAAGTLAPDVDAGGAIKKMEAGSVAIEYRDGAPKAQSFPAIDGILAPLIGVVRPSLFGKTARA